MCKEGSTCGPGGCGDGACGGKGCRCAHHKVCAILVVLFGLLFLAKAGGYVSVETVNWVWPLLVIACGANRLGAGKCKCC